MSVWILRRTLLRSRIVIRPRTQRRASRTDIWILTAVLNYLSRGHGGVFGDRGQNRAPSPLETANYISQRWPEYTQPTLQRIGELPDSEIRTIIDRVPTEFMGDIAKEFAYQIIVTSKTELLKLIR